MNLKQFCSKSALLSKTEIEKVSLLAFYFFRSNGLDGFSVADVSDWFKNLNLPNPNLSRLRANLKRSRKFIRGSDPNTFCLHASEIATLDSLYPELIQESEEIVASDQILPAALYSKTRGFIESLSSQINASYEYNIFDGCAVLMRRLVEILLVLSYQNLGIETEIQDSSEEFKSLNNIIANAKSSKKLGLSRTTKGCIDHFRELGNFSAHKIYYNCKRGDIEKISLEYRAAIEELLYKAGIKM